LTEPSRTIGLSALRKHNILSTDCVPDIDICDDIHDVFHHGNWVGVAKDLYDWLEPSLLLATALLTETATLTWWHRLALGERIVKLDAGGHVSKSYIHYSDSEARSAELDATRAVLLELSRYVRFHWSVENDGHGNNINYSEADNNVVDLDLAMLQGEDDPKADDLRCTTEHGKTSIDHQTLYTNLRSNTFKQANGDTITDRAFYASPAGHFTGTARVVIHADYKRYIEARLSQPTNESIGSANLDRRVHFMLATTLVHELAHALSLMRWGNDHDNEFLGEAYYSLAEYDRIHASLEPKEPELGINWEDSVFGCSIERSDFPDGRKAEWNLPPVSMIPRWGLVWRAREDERYLPFNVTMIPMPYVNQWFREDFWDRLRSGKMKLPVRPPTMDRSVKAWYGDHNGCWKKGPRPRQWWI